MRLRAIRLPEGVGASVAEQVDAVAGLEEREREKRGMRLRLRERKKKKEGNKMGRNLSSLSPSTRSTGPGRQPLAVWCHRPGVLLLVGGEGSEGERAREMRKKKKSRRGA